MLRVVARVLVRRQNLEVRVGRAICASAGRYIKTLERLGVVQRDAWRVRRDSGRITPGGGRGSFGDRLGREPDLQAGWLQKQTLDQASKLMKNRSHNKKD